MAGTRHCAHLCCAAILLLEVQVASGPPAPAWPHFTSCQSRDHKTFRCWWDTGSFWNLSAPGALRVFFLRENDRMRAWHECPEYSATVANECYFGARHTSVWTPYCVQLRSATQDTTYDELRFSIDSIVYPEPPVGLNWTLLNVSRSNCYYDVLVHWEPPPSADVRTGWMNLEYEVHYCDGGSSHWRTLDVVSGTQRSIYGLCMETEYKVQVRCRMVAHDNFSEFSRVLRVFLAQSPAQESSFSVGLVLIFAAVGGGILLLLVVTCQHHRLMVIFLPPVPSPRIKGINTDLLKKGKLDEISSIISRLDHYKGNNINGDLLVDFIELDLEELDLNAENFEPDLTQAVPCCCVQDVHARRENYITSDLPECDLWTSGLEPSACPVNLIPPPSPQSTVSPLAPPPKGLPITHQCGQLATTPYSQVAKVTIRGEFVLLAGEENMREKEMKMTLEVLADRSSCAYTSEGCTMQMSTEFSQRRGYDPSKGAVSLAGPSPSPLNPNMPAPPDSGYTVL
ncbi:growth hormone receptor-like isoform X1 [Arapaima gigas]